MPIISEPDPQWSGATALVYQHLAGALADDWINFICYIAGPPPMVDAVRHHLELECEISLDQFHYHRFF